MAGEFAQGSQRGRDPILHGGPGQRTPQASSFASVTDHDQDGGQSEADLYAYTINTRLGVTVLMHFVSQRANIHASFTAVPLSVLYACTVLYCSVVGPTTAWRVRVVRCTEKADADAPDRTAGRMSRGGRRQIQQRRSQWRPDHVQ